MGGQLTELDKVLRVELINRRKEARVSLSISLELKRTINQFSYQRRVQTVNVSSNGVCVICDLPLRVGNSLEVEAFNGKFAALATVCHVTADQNGSWIIGLWLIDKKGSWVIG